jgi:hypothetical protein
LIFFFSLVIEAQSKAIRDDRRREDDEARGTRFGQQVLDTDVYEEKNNDGYLNYIPRNNEDEVSQLFFAFSLTIVLHCRVLTIGRR